MKVRGSMTMRSSIALAGAAALLLSGCANKHTGGSSGGGASSVKVGIVYSKTGLLAAYGQEYVDGFKAGLSYATKGTGKAAGHEIQVNYADDGGDPAKAVAAMKDYVGQGYKIIGGTDDSGIATQLAPLAAQNKVLYISGPAATDAITGINRYTFRSGRETYQDVATAGTFTGNTQGKKVLVFAQDSTFGQGNAAAVKQVLGAKGADVSQVLVPATATDFTPFAQRAKQAKADMIFVAWAGTTTPAMWQALDQQGVLDSTTVVTGLANAASFDAYGSGSTKIKFLSYYFPGAASNDVNKAMVDAVTKAGSTPDLFTPDGFVAAQMIVHAIESANGSDVDKMISGLEGWTFDAPKGSETVRKSDHAMIQPMFEAQLVKNGAHYQPKLVNTVDANTVAPPEKASS